MIVPKILPGEWIRGYRIRIARSNDVSIVQRPEEILWFHVNNSLRHEPHAGSLIDLAARVAGRKLMPVVKEHTLWPAQVGIESMNDAAGCRMAVQGSDGAVAIVRTLRKAAFYCPVCAGNDIENLGFSYWRRDHQLPGVIMCGQHVELLRTVDREISKQLFPHECGACSEVWNVSERMSSQVRQRVNRVTNVCAAMINTHEVHSITDVRTRLTNAALDLGYEPNEYGQFIAVNSLADEYFPEPWLEDAFPGLKTTLQHGQFLNCVFAPGVHYVTAMRCALATVVLEVAPACSQGQLCPDEDVDF